MGQRRVTEIRALFFINSFAGGGAERVCLNLAKQLYKSKIESDFVTVYNRKDYDVPDYIHIFSLGLDWHSSFTKIFLEIIKGAVRVNVFISGKKYILITANLPLSHILASLTKVGKKCLYVMQVSQHLVDRDNSYLYRCGLRLFLKGKRTVTVSKGLESELIGEYGIESDHVTTIYNPCYSNDLKSEMQSVSPHVRPYILIMGRLEQQKNPEVALDLYIKGKFYEQYDLVYLGQGSLEKNLKKKIKEYHLQDNVFMEGFQKNPEQWLRNAQLLLSCSSQEGLPLNLVEALACGTPVVAADCPWGPNEILTGELAQYLIDLQKDPEKSISVIASALKSYPKITEKYYKKFAVESILQTYLMIWEKYF